MRATQSGIHLTKPEITALLECAATSSENPALCAVAFTAVGDTIRAHATDSSIACEATGANDGLEGRFVVRRDFLEAVHRQARAKSDALLAFDEDDPGELQEAIISDEVTGEDGETETIERCRIRWPESALVAQTELPLGEGPALRVGKPNSAVPCVSLSAQHLAAVALIARAAGRDTVDLWTQRSRVDPVGLEIAGRNTTWVVVVVPCGSDEPDEKPSEVESVTLSSGGQSVTLTAETGRRIRKAIRAGRKAKP